MKPKERAAKQVKKQESTQKNGKEQYESVERQDKQQMQSKEKKNAKKQSSKLTKVFIQIDSSLSPMNQNVALIDPLQQFQINSLGLLQIYNNIKQGLDMVIRPLSVVKQENKSKVLIMKKGLKNLKEEHLKIDSQFIFVWLVEFCYKLHPKKLKLQTEVYLKIHKNQLYVEETPFMPSIKLKQQSFTWINPLKIILLDEVKDEGEYFGQMIEFDERFKTIKNFQTVEKIHCRLKQPKQSQFYSVNALCSRIKEEHLLNSLKQSQSEEPTQFLDEGRLRWAMQQVGLQNSLRPYIFYRASQCSFEPQQFWSKLSNVSKGQHKGQLLVLQIDCIPSKAIGFYSTLITNLDLNLVKSPFPSYIKDGSKKSVVINFTQRVVHPLIQKQFGFAVGREFLICIGKCDIVLGAFNLSNLCYFPTSFEPDVKMLSATAESLCGSKRFGLKQLYVYRFENMKQKP